MKTEKIQEIAKAYVTHYLTEFEIDFDDLVEFVEDRYFDDFPGCAQCSMEEIQFYTEAYFGDLAQQFEDRDR